MVHSVFFDKINESDFGTHAAGVQINFAESYKPIHFTMKNKVVFVQKHPKMMLYEVLHAGSPICLITLWCLINVPPRLLIFRKFSHPPDLIWTPRLLIWKSFSFSKSNGGLEL